MKKPVNDLLRLRVSWLARNLIEVDLSAQGKSLNGWQFISNREVDALGDGDRWSAVQRGDSLCERITIVG